MNSVQIIFHCWCLRFFRLPFRGCQRFTFGLLRRLLHVILFRSRHFATARRFLDSSLKATPEFLQFVLGLLEFGFDFGQLFVLRLQILFVSCPVNNSIPSIRVGSSAVRESARSLEHSISVYLVQLWNSLNLSASESSRYFETSPSWTS